MQILLDFHSGVRHSCNKNKNYVIIFDGLVLKKPLINKS